MAIIILTAFFLPSNAQPVTNRKPDGLAVSTGNLYFTSHDNTGAAVWRASQSSVPGREGILYWEVGATFGDITLAKVGNDYFGYFFAKKAGVITIRRVPLGGGTVTVLATVTGVDVANSHHNLVNDGSELFWQTSTSICKMPINGGAVTVLDRTQTNTPTAGIEWQYNRIVYADGREIRYVPVSGTTTLPQTRRIAIAPNRVTTLHTGSSYVFWGEQNGAVRRILNGATAATTLQPASSFIPVAIANDGEAYAWSECGSNSCALRASFSRPPALEAGTYWLSLLTGRNIFWGGATGVNHSQF